MIHSLHFQLSLIKRTIISFPFMFNNIQSYFVCTFDRDSENVFVSIKILIVQWNVAEKLLWGLLEINSTQGGTTYWFWLQNKFSARNQELYAQYTQNRTNQFFYWIWFIIEKKLIVDIISGNLRGYHPCRSLSNHFRNIWHVKSSYHCW